jgi:SAM-dependent methyltransferase
MTRNTLSEWSSALPSKGGTSGPATAPSDALSEAAAPRRLALCVQYGCGLRAPDGWLNFDASPTLKFERFPILSRLYTKNRQRFPRNVIPGDILKGLPVPDGSCDRVYASHVLHHLSLADFHRAIDNTYRILRPGGTFLCVVPDLQVLAERYLADSKQGSGQAATRFMLETCLGREQRRRTLWAFLIEWLGASRPLWMWDCPSLAAALRAHRFQNIRPCYLDQLPDHRFQDVVDASRFAEAVALAGER